MGLFLLAYLCVNIAFRAKARGQSPLPWVLKTVLFGLLATFVAMMIIVITWMVRYDYGSSPKDMDKMQELIKSGELGLSDWNVLFVLVCTFGGYLFVRYRLDKYPKLNNDGQGGSPSE